MQRGYLDHVTRHCIRGWAIDTARPGEPLRVEVRIDGESAAVLLANGARADLMQRFGTSRHGFELFLPGLCALRRHVISARIEGAEHDLEGSPVILESATAFGDEAEASLARMLQSADLPTLDRATIFLGGQIDAILERRAGILAGREARDLKYRWFAHRGAAGLAPPRVPRRALLVAATAPDLSDGIDGFLVASHALALRRIGYDVGFVASDLSPLDGPEGVQLVTAGVQGFARPFSASVEEVLRRQESSFDIVVLLGLAQARRYVPLVRELLPRACLVYAPLVRSQTNGDDARLGFFDAIAARRYAEAHAMKTASVTIFDLTQDPSGLANDVPETRLRPVSWAVDLDPTMIPLAHRRGIILIDEPLQLAPAVRDLLAQTIDLVIMRCDSPFLGWEGADAATTVSAAPSARLGLTLATDARAHRAFIRHLGSGLPCIAPVRMIRDLGLPEELIVCDTAKPHDLADAIIRLHEDATANDAFRRRALDDLDYRHAPMDVAAAWRAAIRTGRAAPSAGGPTRNAREPADR